MPRYYVDTSDGETFVLDDIGLEVADLEAVKNAAVDVLPDMARDKLPDGDRRLFLAVVRDAQGRTVLQASLALNVTLLPNPEARGG